MTLRTPVWLVVCSLNETVAWGSTSMKRIALLLALLPIIFARPAHAQTFTFAWESQAWTKSYESPTHYTISGPFNLSGTSTVTFAELVTTGVAARTLTFGGSYGGTLIASGDGTYNGAITFPTTSGETRSGLGVLTPTSNGFTVVVQRAASGPDAGATFAGTASPLPVTSRAATTGSLGAAGSASATASASEPTELLAVAAGLALAARLRIPRRLRVRHAGVGAPS